MKFLLSIMGDIMLSLLVFAIPIGLVYGCRHLSEQLDSHFVAKFNKLEKRAHEIGVLKILRIERVPRFQYHTVYGENKAGQRFEVASCRDVIPAVGDYWTIQPNYRCDEANEFTLYNRVSGFE